MDEENRIKELESQIEWMEEDMANMREELKYLRRKNNLNEQRRP